MHIYVYKTIGSAIGIDTIHNVETQNKIEKRETFTDAKLFIN